jgi:hypothetical protein
LGGVKLEREHQHDQPIGRVVRWVCGALGCFLVLLGFLGIALGDAQTLGGAVIAFLFGGLFLIPAFGAGPPPAGATSGSIAAKAARLNRIAILLGSIGLIGLALSAAAQKDWLPLAIAEQLSARGSLLVLSGLWFTGFILRFFVAYYSAQSSSLQSR